MQTYVHSPWWPRSATFVLASLAAASIVFWSLKVSGVGASTATAAEARTGPLTIDPAAVARGLGAGQLAAAAAPAANTASRFTVVGVLADLRAGGAALIAVDGNPAKPYRVGEVVEDGFVLRSVTSRSASLASSPSGPVAITLELPALKQ